jgi:RimJ/RimL family protein N-acetyltransferase
MTEFALSTERLILREWREVDAAPFRAICTDPEVMRYLGSPLTAEAIDAAIGRQRASQAARGHCFWAMERRADGALLGFCGLQAGPEGTPIANRIEIGWRLRSDSWGQGYAREAAEAALDWAWTHLDEDVIWAITVPANARSWGLMERLGMTRHADFEFNHPALAADSPLLRHITYSIGRPQ